MTIEEMYKSVLQRVHSMQGELEIPSEDVERALNYAIDTFIKNRFQPEANRLREGFEMSQVRVSDLRKLVKTSSNILPISVDANFQDNIYIDAIELPSDFMFLLKVSAIVHYNTENFSFTINNSRREADGTKGTDYSEKKVACKYIQIDDIHSVAADPFNKPIINSPKFTINDNTVYIYTDNKFIVDEGYVTYIKEPKKVSIENEIDSDLAPSTHEDIVEIAANFILKTRGVQPQEN